MAAYSTHNARPRNSRSDTHHTSCRYRAAPPHSRNIGISQVLPLSIPLEIHPKAFTLPRLALAAGRVVCDVELDASPAFIEIVVKRRRIAAEHDPSLAGAQQFCKLAVLIVAH